MSAVRLVRIARNVADLPQAVAFYRDALGFEPLGSEERDPGLARLLGREGATLRTIRLGLGAQEIELTQFDPPGAPYPPGASAADLSFQHVAIVTSDVAAAARRVQARGAIAITQGGPQALPASSGGVIAFKFRDPEGHPLELIQFPPGTGAAAWQVARPGGLTIGIDHSALSVADADRSIRFYGAGLGLRQISRGVNHGPEQARLDDLCPDVCVDVVALRPAASATPHLELLGYRTPRGRPRPPQSRPGDCVATRLVLQVDDLPVVLAALAPADPALAPGGTAALADGSRAALTRDPDGHELLLVE